MYTLQAGKQHGVAAAVCSKWAKGTGGPAGDECQNMVTHPLTSEGHDASEDGTGGNTPVVAVAQNQRGELRTGDIMPQLTCGGGKPGEGYPCVAFEPGSVARNAGPAGESPQCPTLRSHMGDNQPAVREGMAVRRLTPTECERLQGFPGGWTEGQADSARYRQLGNAVCVPVAEWIGRRIMQTTTIRGTENGTPSGRRRACAIVVVKKYPRDAANVRGMAHPHIWVTFWFYRTGRFPRRSLSFSVRLRGR